MVVVPLVWKNLQVWASTYGRLKAMQNVVTCFAPPLDIATTLEVSDLKSLRMRIVEIKVNPVH